MWSYQEVSFDWPKVAQQDKKWCEVTGITGCGDLQKNHRILIALYFWINIHYATSVFCGNFSEKIWHFRMSSIKELKIRPTILRRMAIHHLYIHCLLLGSADGLENPIQQLGLDENRKRGNPRGTTRNCLKANFASLLRGGNLVNIAIGGHCSISGFSNCLPLVNLLNCLSWSAFAVDISCP